MNGSRSLPPLDLPGWMQLRLLGVEAALDRWVAAPPGLQATAGLVDAMRYAVLDGGKRLRPLLVLAAAEAVMAAGTQPPDAPGLLAVMQPPDAPEPSGASQPPDESALRAACAVELIHAYSLVHDDMPCMDNDVLRRGKPTVHVRHGEAGALLAGDALQALAFELLTPADERLLPLARQARLCGLLARAAGHTGMAGGQAIDLASVGRVLDEDRLREMHRLKTGALLQASVLLGAACGTPDDRALDGLSRFGAAIGLAFQVVDDVLDVTGDAATLGKTAGKDAEHDKPTYVALMGLERSRALAQALRTQALQALDDSGLPDTRALAALADRVVLREH